MYCFIDRMRSSCGLDQVREGANMASSEALEFKRTDSTDSSSTLVRGDSIASVATSAGDYTPAYDDGVAAFEDQDL